MQTFDPSFTGATYSSSVSPLPLRSGLTNTSSLDFGPGGDDDGLNDDNYTVDKPIQFQLFNAMTVELAFNMDVIGGFQALFGKDGQPLAGSGSPVPSLKVLIRGDDFPDAIPNQLFVEFIDGDGDIHFVASRQTFVAGQWNHIAFTLTDTTAELWLAGETGPYTKLDSITDDFAGSAGEVLITDPRSFSIGRGMFNNNPADWSDAKIDEVRVSDTLLDPGQFLFMAAPQNLLGDYNNDGIVDAADYTVWADHFGQNFPAADGNNDGTVDAADYTIWADHFGEGTPPGGPNGAVPEPAGIAFAATVAGAAAVRRRR